MRRLTLTAIFFALSGLACAQQHSVSVHVPAVLRLRLAESPSRIEAVRIEVAGGGYRINPGHTDLEVLANSDWQLSASYAPASARDADAKLLWRLADGGGWQPFSPFATTLASGTQAGGWQRLRVHYGLDAPLPADGTYEGVITYTLSRP